MKKLMYVQGFQHLGERSVDLQPSPADLNRDHTEFTSRTFLPWLGRWNGELHIGPVIACRLTQVAWHTYCRWSVTCRLILCSHGGCCKKIQSGANSFYELINIYRSAHVGWEIRVFGDEAQSLYFKRKGEAVSSVGSPQMELRCLWWWVSLSVNVLKCQKYEQR